MGYSFATNATIQGPPSTLDEFREDVLRGLALPQKRISCKYFYDAAGSKLFEEICRLPEYYPTRTELGILRASVAEMARQLGRNCLLIEYGSGASTKTRLLLDHLIEPAGYVPVDIAREQLRASCLALAQDYPALDIRPICADFTRTIDLTPHSDGVRHLVVYFPGSTIGNLESAEAIELLRQTAHLVGPGGGLLLGADLKKDPQVLHQAYNDRAGITAAFNMNLLTRINRELGGRVWPEQFWHHAFYNPAESRIEMHLVSREDQQIQVDGRRFAMAEGESIRTEYSHKYSLQDLRTLAEASGFALEQTWADERNYFTVQYWSVPSASPTTNPRRPGSVSPSPGDRPAS